MRLLRSRLHPIIVPRYFGLVPAAGTGSRFGEGVPKQYQVLGAKPLLYYAVRALAAHPMIEEVFVVLAPDDSTFQALWWRELGKPIRPLHCGGDTRAASVQNGLSAMRHVVANEDWVLVHDAARPCLSTGALERLVGELGSDETGGLLAIPVADTLKRGDSRRRVVATEDRGCLWQAQTPQMFRYGVLSRAFSARDSTAVTDEAAAVEALGLKPKLVTGELRNLKVTYPDDLKLAALIFESDERSRAS
jgi:2-C-methyl-D-erythritol 4-phosphate cytidylyltransferase